MVVENILLLLERYSFSERCPLQFIICLVLFIDVSDERLKITFFSQAHSNSESKKSSYKRPTSPPQELLYCLKRSLISLNKILRISVTIPQMNRMERKLYLLCSFRWKAFLVLLKSLILFCTVFLQSIHRELPIGCTS